MTVQQNNNHQAMTKPAASKSIPIRKPKLQVDIPGTTTTTRALKVVTYEIPCPGAPGDCVTFSRMEYA